MSNKQSNPLWTRDFTILTVGSVISMFGNAMTGFAMSLMVLDLSNSTLLYAIYLAMYTLPQLFMPIVSGAILDRQSRKKTIYTLDGGNSAQMIFLGRKKNNTDSNPETSKDKEGERPVTDIIYFASAWFTR